MVDDVSNTLKDRGSYEEECRMLYINGECPAGARNLSWKQAGVKASGVRVPDSPQLGVCLSGLSADLQNRATLVQIQSRPQSKEVVN